MRAVTVALVLVFASMMFAVVSPVPSARADPSSPALDGTSTGTWSSGTTFTIGPVTTSSTNDVIVVWVNTYSTNDHVVSLSAPGINFQNEPRQYFTANLPDHEITLTEWYGIATGILTSVTITVTLSAAPGAASGLEFGVSGANTVDPFEWNPSLPATNTGDGSLAVPSVNGVYGVSANDFVFAIYGGETLTTETTGSIGGTPATEIGSVHTGTGNSVASDFAEYVTSTALNPGTCDFGTSTTYWGVLCDAIVPASASTPPTYSVTFKAPDISSAIDIAGSTVVLTYGTASTSSGCSDTANSVTQSLLPYTVSVARGDYVCYDYVSPITGSTNTYNFAWAYVTGWSYWGWWGYWGWWFPLGAGESGTFQVNDRSTVTAFYTWTALVSYSVTFDQSGIPAGLTWGVTVSGTDHTGTGPSITVTGLTGSNDYSYDTPVPGATGVQYACTEETCSGTVTHAATVSGSYVTQYLISFVQTGSILPVVVSFNFDNGTLGTGTAPFTLWADAPTGSVSYSYPTPVGSVHLTTLLPYSPLSFSGPSTVFGEYSSISTAVSTTTSVSCSPSSISGGSTATCKATVTGSSPTGTVTFSQSGTGSVILPSPATCTLSGGTCSITVTGTAAGSVTLKASYGGDSTNAPSSGTTTITVTATPFAGSITFTACTPTYGTKGDYTGITLCVTNSYTTTENLVIYATFKSGSSTYIAQGTTTLTPGQTLSVFCIDEIPIPAGSYSVTFSATTTSNQAVSAPTTPITVVVPL